MPDFTLPELLPDQGLPPGGTRPKGKDFKTRLRELLSEVSSGLDSVVAGPAPGIDDPVNPADVAASKIDDIAHPRGFAQIMSQFAKNRGETRLATQQALEKQVTAQGTRAKTAAETRATDALAGERQSQSDLNQAKTRSEDLKGMISSAKAPAELKLIETRVDALKGDIDGKIADTQLALARARSIGDQTTISQREQDLKELTQAQKYYVDLKDIDIKNRQADIGQQNADTNTTNAKTNKQNADTNAVDVAGKNKMRAAISDLYGSQSVRERGKALGNTPEGKAAIAKMESESGLNSATALSRLDAIDTKNETAVMTELKSMKQLGYSDEAIDQAMRAKQEEGELSPAFKPERGGFLNFIKKEFGVGGAGSATPAPASQPAAVVAPSAAAPVVPRGTQASGQIAVINPQGQPGFIPADQWPEAEKQGFKKR